MQVKKLVTPVVGLLKGDPVHKLMSPIGMYTRLVILGRNFLWVLIAGLVGVVFWLASDSHDTDSARIVFTNIPKSDALQNEMVKPHYQGLDAKNNPYTVIADKAVQKDKNTVILQAISADMMQKEGAWLALNAGSGELDIQSKHMVLKDNVSMFYEGGYEFQTDHAQVDIDKGSAYGDAKVKGQGPMGTLQANGFSVEGRGDVIRFTGSVKVRIYR